jgi:DMSO/TMAO reductase YedYZ molybdopterin-dependent catalytic subunit
METRRNFVTKVFTGIVSLGFILQPILSAARMAYARAEKIIVTRGTPRETLTNQNPKDLDTTDLEITPLAEFKTMGLDDLEVDVNQWRLLVEGEVGKSLSLNYSELTALPAVEKAVLLICPGFFANNGVWKGVSVKELLTRANVSKDVNYVTFRGPEGNYEKVFKVPLNEVIMDKVFLAYQVNGEVLPIKHGFPLRVVAEGYYGSDWVKYVYKVTADVVRE